VNSGDGLFFYDGSGDGLLISASKDITVHEMCPLNWLSGKELVH
jgi:hypothetical protein